MTARDDTSPATPNSTALMRGLVRDGGARPRSRPTARADDRPATEDASPARLAAPRKVAPDGTHDAAGAFPASRGVRGETRGADPRPAIALVVVGSRHAVPSAVRPGDQRPSRSVDVGWRHRDGRSSRPASSTTIVGGPEADRYPVYLARRHADRVRPDVSRRRRRCSPWTRDGRQPDPARPMRRSRVRRDVATARPGRRRCDGWPSARRGKLWVAQNRRLAGHAHGPRGPRSRRMRSGPRPPSRRDARPMASETGMRRHAARVKADGTGSRCVVGLRRRRRIDDSVARLVARRPTGRVQLVGGAARPTS